MSLLGAVARSGPGMRAALGIAGVALGTTVAACADDTAKMFDPEALERGAKALREIQKSPYAKKVRRGGDGTMPPPPPAAAAASRDSSCPSACSECRCLSKSSSRRPPSSRS